VRGIRAAILAALRPPPRRVRGVLVNAREALERTRRALCRVVVESGLEFGEPEAHAVEGLDSLELLHQELEALASALDGGEPGWAPRRRSRASSGVPPPRALRALMNREVRRSRSERGRPRQGSNRTPRPSRLPRDRLLRRAPRTEGPPGATRCRGAGGGHSPGARPGLQPAPPRPEGAREGPGGPRQRVRAPSGAVHQVDGALAAVLRALDGWLRMVPRDSPPPRSARALLSELGALARQYAGGPLGPELQRSAGELARTLALASSPDPEAIRRAMADTGGVRLRAFKRVQLARPVRVEGPVTLGGHLFADRRLLLVECPVPIALDLASGSEAGARAWQSLRAPDPGRPTTLVRAEHPELARAGVGQPRATRFRQQWRPRYPWPLSIDALGYPPSAVVLPGVAPLSPAVPGTRPVRVGPR
jgi:hypothetical protein